MRPLETLSVWMAIDDATPANGGMRFIPGSHKTRRTYGNRPLFPLRGRTGLNDFTIGR